MTILIARSSASNSGPSQVLSICLHPLCPISSTSAYQCLQFSPSTDILSSHQFHAYLSSSFYLHPNISFTLKGSCRAPKFSNIEYYPKFSSVCVASQTDADTHYSKYFLCYRKSGCGVYQCHYAVYYPQLNLRYKWTGFQFLSPVETHLLISFTSTPLYTYTLLLGSFIHSIA